MNDTCNWVKGCHSVETCWSDIDIKTYNSFKRQGAKYCPFCGRKIKVKGGGTARANDMERFYRCLTCCHIENCNLDEKAEDKRGMCTKYHYGRVTCISGQRKNKNTYN